MNQSTRPKPTPSAYLVFCSAKRAELQSAHPTATFVDLGKMFGQIWATYTAEEKAVYVEQANQLKMQQKQELTAVAAATSNSSSSAIEAAAVQGHHTLIDVSLGQLEESLVDPQHLEE